MLRTGNALGTVVAEAMAQMADAAQSMQGTEHEASLGEALQRNSRDVADYLASFDTATEALRAEVDKATGACGSIASLVREYDLATLTCDALAMYMKIEVARLPDKDRHVGVIADELRSLSTSIHALADTVRSVSSGLLKELPAVAASVQRTRARRDAISSSLRQSTDDIGAVAEKLEKVLRISTSDGASAEIVRCSQEALSRLQYHDPLIQEVQTLDALAAQIRSAVAGAAGAPEAFEPLRYAVRLGDVPTSGGNEDGSTVEAGEMLLF